MSGVIRETLSVHFISRFYMVSWHATLRKINVKRVKLHNFFLFDIVVKILLQALEVSNDLVSVKEDMDDQEAYERSLLQQHVEKLNSGTSIGGLGKKREKFRGAWKFCIIVLAIAKMIFSFLVVVGIKHEHFGISCMSFFERFYGRDFSAIFRENVFFCNFLAEIPIRFLMRYFPYKNWLLYFFSLE